MALIICPECGKRFSDKAACCPECGCPTSAIVGASAESAASREQRSAEASAKMQETVRQARSRAKAAEASFDRSAADIQRSASREIDLFGGDFHSSVVGLAADSRRACDELYASYQLLIESVDRTCRPLLEQAPSAEAIMAVRDLIRFLNDESEIENNFAASFNGASLGNVGSAKYVPKMSNKMIQKFWEQQYASTPEAKEAEKRRQEAREAERKRQAEQRRREEEARQKERERKEVLAREGKERLQQLTEQGQQRARAFRGELDGELARRAEQIRAALEVELSAARQEKTRLEQELAALGVLQLGAKRRTKEAVVLAESKIQKLSDPQLLENEKLRLRQIADAAIAAYQRAIDAVLDRRFPGRRTGKDPVERYLEKSSAAAVPLPEPPEAGSVFDTNI